MVPTASKDLRRRRRRHPTKNNFPPIVSYKKVENCNAYGVSIKSISMEWISLFFLKKKLKEEGMVRTIEQNRICLLWFVRVPLDTLFCLVLFCSWTVCLFVLCNFVWWWEEQRKKVTDKIPDDGAWLLNPQFQNTHSFPPSSYAYPYVGAMPNLGSAPDRHPRRDTPRHARLSKS